MTARRIPVTQQVKALGTRYLLPSSSARNGRCGGRLPRSITPKPDSPACTESTRQSWLRATLSFARIPSGSNIL